MLVLFSAAIPVVFPGGAKEGRGKQISRLSLGICETHVGLVVISQEDLLPCMC